jgi:hypothetical protein
LLDKRYGLYVRDSRYFDRRDDQGRKIFWSRGNGWVYAGIVNILKTLPANHPSRPRYVALFKRMSAQLVSLQKPDGYWSVSLLAPEHSPPESSGTGFFVYGLAWGVNQGPAEGSEIRASARQGLDGPGQGRAARRQAGLGAAGRLRARPRRGRRHPALRLGRVPFGRLRSVAGPLLAGPARLKFQPPPRAGRSRAHTLARLRLREPSTWHLEHRYSE